MVGTSPEHRIEAESIILKVLNEVADHEEVDPIDLSPPLYEAIDADALEALLTDSISGDRRDSIRVDFHYCGYDVSVKGDGEIEISSEKQTN